MRSTGMSRRPSQDPYRDLAKLALAVKAEAVREPTITASLNPAPEVAATPV